MLLAVPDKFGDNIDVIERLAEDRIEEETVNTLAALYRDTPFLQRDFIGNDGLKKENVYVELNDDPPEMVEKNCKTELKIPEKMMFQRKGRRL